MKLIERELGLEIELKENRISVLVIENISRRLAVIGQLYDQAMGKEGAWMLVEHEHAYDLSKKCDIILELFSLEMNNKKVKAKLYQEMKEVADEACYESGLALHAHICNYLETVLEKIPYPLDYTNAWDVSNILKMYNVKIPEECDDLYEKLLNYIHLMNQICGIQIFVLINAKQFFTKKQILELYKMVSYSKIQLVLIEFDALCSRYPQEDIYILDQDDCIIQY